MNMEYRRLGPAGLQVSVLSLGSWVSFGEQIGTAEAIDTPCPNGSRDAALKQAVETTLFSMGGFGAVQ